MIPVKTFKFKGAEVRFVGFVHGAPPKYVISDEVKKELDVEISKADVVLCEGYSKKGFEESVGKKFSGKNWVGLDSDKAIDKLEDCVGEEKAIELLKGVQLAGKKKVKKGKHPLLLRALKGDAKALKELQEAAPACEGVECLWDELRNLRWVENVLVQMHEGKKCIVVLGGIGHAPIMKLLREPFLFEERYKALYGLMKWEAHEMVEEMQKG